MNDKNRKGKIDTPRTQLAKQFFKTSLRSPLAEIGNRTNSLFSEASQSSRDSVSPDLLIPISSPDRRLSTIIEHSTPDTPKWSGLRFNGSLFHSPTTNTPGRTLNTSPLVPRMNISVGWDSDDFEVSKLSGISNLSSDFRPINDDSLLNEVENELFSELNTSAILHTKGPQKRKRTNECSPRKSVPDKRSRTQSVRKRKYGHQSRLSNIFIRLRKSKPIEPAKKKSYNVHPALKVPAQKPTLNRKRTASVIPTPKLGLQRCISIQPDQAPREIMRPSSTIQSMGPDSWESEVFRDIAVEEVAAIVSRGKRQIEGRVFERHIIIDARYDYEYKGGHIKDAINVPKVEENVYKETLKKMFFEGQDAGSLSPKKNNDNVIIIFHCEFSSQRGPELRRCLRKIDREYNIYPNLSYRNLFLMTGGYKNFYLNVSDSNAYSEGKRKYIEELNPQCKADREINKDRRKKEKKAKKKADMKRYDLRERIPNNKTGTPVRRSNATRRRSRRNSSSQK